MKALNPGCNARSSTRASSPYKTAPPISYETEREEETMAKKQTRRSVSVKGLTYERLMDLAQRRGETGSGMLEILIHERCEAEGVPMPTVLRPRPEKKRAALEAEEIRSQHFTF